MTSIPVKGAGEHFSADKCARVVDIDAAELGALVPAARALLLATTFAAGIVGSAGQAGARYLLVHVAAAAPHQGGLSTRGTGSCT